MSARERQAEVMAAALDCPQYLPGGHKDRHDCKVLVKRGLLEANGCMGYRPTAKAREAYDEPEGFWLHVRAAWERLDNDRVLMQLIRCDDGE